MRRKDKGLGGNGGQFAESTRSETSIRLTVRDSAGRPISDDEQFVGDGIEWVPRDSLATSSTGSERLPYSVSIEEDHAFYDAVAQSKRRTVAARKANEALAAAEKNASWRHPSSRRALRSARLDAAGAARKKTVADNLIDQYLTHSPMPAWAERLLAPCPRCGDTQIEHLPEGDRPCSTCG